MMSYVPAALGLTVAVGGYHFWSLGVAAGTMPGANEDGSVPKGAVAIVAGLGGLLVYWLAKKAV